MTNNHRPTGAGLAALAACAAFATPAPAGALPPGPPRGEPAPLASMDRATTVGAAGGWRAWSEHRDGRYRLVLRSPQGATTTPRIASRRVPFDLDLGRDASGRVVAAFSRCKHHEPTLTGGANASAPNYAAGRGCRISVLDLASGTERRLGRSRGSDSDVLPSVGGARIAFVAVHRPKAGRGTAELRWRTAGSPRSKRLDRGPWRGGRPNVAGGPAGVDTDGVRVAAVWRALDDEFNSFDSVLRVGRFTGRPRQVAFGVNNDICNYDQVLAPTLHGTTVSYVETDGASWMLARTSVARQAPRYGTFRTGEPGVIVTGAAVDGSTLVVGETAAPAGVGHAAGPTVVRTTGLGPQPGGVGSFTLRAPLAFCDG